ncbi:bifunctional GNAT family N-acetyltransferase/hotdog fold thioesterase [Planctobacterium marinum]|uniref:GNAT family N-acetyltransferase n=1 Tax=Planctobacterium marinum TaxID=1631968 RepID=A0AA48HJE6_9ALTE|nr:GNAT family N-acetyltransferase [Planctobacterium marinum]
MYRISTPVTPEEMEAYFLFRWQVLREPFNFPQGSEKDEYEGVAEHRMLLSPDGDIVAVGRVHLNVQEEAQIRHIAVSAKHRKKGLGSLILSALEEEAKKQGALRAVTNSLDTSVAFFASAGYYIEDTPEALGKQKRQHMVKKLDVQSTVRLHPKWCTELQSTWHETIPISEQMGITLHQYTGKTLEARASLNKNINLHGSMFAGSIFSLATLTGWGMIFLQLKERGLEGDIVLGDGNVHYHKPVTAEPRAICNIETMSGKFHYIERKKKCRLELQVNIQDGDIAVAEFYGVYWVLPIIE